jgi:hypothetical protein
VAKLPSPFLERDLDRDAEDYIVGSTSGVVMTDTSDSIPATTTKIEINLSRLPQLFNSLD